MSDQDKLLDDLKHHVATAEDVDADFSPLIAEDASELVAALFALAPAQEVRGQWAEQTDFEMCDAMGKVAWVSSESEEVEQAIDEMLAGGERETAADALARAGVAWDSPAFTELLDHDGSRRAAALITAIADPQSVAAWLDGCEVIDDALEVLRAAALDVAGDLREAFLAWEEALAEGEDADAERARLDGLFATLDPENYARRVLAGDSEINWLLDLPVVADFLQVHGPTEWLEVLGLLEATEDRALEFGTLLAVCAAAGIGMEPPTEEEAHELLELLTIEPGAKVEEWEPLATRLSLGFAVAVAPDEDLGLLCAQAAAHERLSSFDIHSPGIPGLPLSATDEDSLDLEASRGLLDSIRELDEMPVASTLAVIRTLSDLRGLVANDNERFEEHAEHWIEQFLDSDSRAIRLAVRQLLVTIDHEARDREAELLEQSNDIEAALTFSSHPFDEEIVVSALEQHAHVEGPLGLDCARRLAAIGSDAALAALARLWKSENVFRAPFYRDALVEGIVRSM